LAKSINFIEMLSGGKIPDVMLGAWIVMGLLLIFGALARLALSRREDPMVPPDRFGLVSISEAAVEWIDSFVHEVLETHNYRGMVPFFGSLFIFILGCNYFGLIPGMEPPTADSDLTFALGAVCFAYYIVQGFRAQGPGYLKSFLGPYMPLVFLLFPIEVADNLFRPFSLGIRLYANMFADHTVLGIATGLAKLIVPIAFYALGAIVCIVQALIFMVLTMAYVRMASSHEH
jgi:F-type H+-transporting ATPase subunit a